MLSSEGRYSAETLGAVTRSWGHQPAGPHPSRAEAQNRAILSRGLLATVDLACGIRLCLGDLTVAHDHERSAIVSPSLTVMFTLSGDNDLYRFERQQAVEISAGSGWAIAAGEHATLSGRYRAGQRSISLVLNAVPERVVDSELAERLSNRLRQTTIRLVRGDVTTRAIAERYLLNPALDVVGRLRLESLALDLLADALEQDPSSDTDQLLCGKDLAAIRRVCDYLSAAPERDHSLSELALIACMSVSSLKRKFPAATGQTVFEFLRDRKFEHAHQGLVRKGWTLKQAAWAAGYRHPGNFAAAYRRRYGALPARARA